jgi:hypothetical protein
VISLADQIKEVQRELMLRERVYPKFVESGKMTQQQADLHMQRLKAALATLQGME